MCFQFTPTAAAATILLAQPAEKLHQYYSEPAFIFLFFFRYNAACKRTRQLSHLIMTPHKQRLACLSNSCP